MVHLGGKKSFLDPKRSLYAFGWISVELFWGRKMQTAFLKAKASCMTPSKKCDNFVRRLNPHYSFMLFLGD